MCRNVFYDSKMYLFGIQNKYLKNVSFDLKNCINLKKISKVSRGVSFYVDVYFHRAMVFKKL